MNNGNFQGPPGYPQYPPQGGYAPSPAPGFTPPQQPPPGYAPPGFTPPAPMPPPAAPQGPPGGFAPGPGYAPPQAPQGGFAPPGYGPAAQHTQAGYNPPAPQGSGMFRGANGTQMFQSGEYFSEAGEYDVRVVDIVQKNTRKQGPAVIVEFEVIRSSTAGTPVGCKRSWLQAIQNAQVAFPNLLEFVAVVGFNVDKSNPQAVQWVNTQLAPNVERFLEELVQSKTIEGRSVIGKVLHVSTSNGVTKGKGIPIIKVRLSVAQQGA